MTDGLQVPLRLAIGRHGPVTLCVRPLSLEEAETYWPRRHCRAVCVRYRGHPGDLNAIGCLPSGTLRKGRLYDDGREGFFSIHSKAGPGHRGVLEVQYYTHRRDIAVALPGVQKLFANSLVQMKRALLGLEGRVTGGSVS
jgi:hypothetical protein